MIIYIICMSTYVRIHYVCVCACVCVTQQHSGRRRAGVSLKIMEINDILSYVPTDRPPKDRVPHNSRTAFTRMRSLKRTAQGLSIENLHRYYTTLTLPTPSLSLLCVNLYALAAERLFFVLFFNSARVNVYMHPTVFRGFHVASVRFAFH